MSKSVITITFLYLRRSGSILHGRYHSSNSYFLSMDVFAHLFLMQTKSRELQKLLEPIVSSLREHVLTCLELCYAKGFICEICQNEKSIIFPFDVPTTSVCPGLSKLIFPWRVFISCENSSCSSFFSVCQSCFHIQCYRNQKLACPKCQRARHRKCVKRNASSIIHCHNFSSCSSISTINHDYRPINS